MSENRSRTGNVSAGDGGKKDIWHLCEDGEVDKVETMLKAGTSPNKTTEREKTPLHYAVIGGALKVVRALLRAGASISAKDSTGKTPLDYCKMFVSESKYDDDKFLRQNRLIQATLEQRLARQSRSSSSSSFSWASPSF